MASRQRDLSAAIWRKSSYSNGDGGNCVEVAMDFPGAAHWRKSSHSNGDGGDCIEVADNLPGLVPVRDTKTAPNGPTVIIPAAAWTRFVTAVKDDAFRA
ncbi:DUF397 domain-containing protein [Streptomyces natalensis]|uniref:Toxin n=1 Tax=Streptomyces natalensis ATCC 27448 TaxID=1240678 RepID=A0A0D7CDB2_9ACTN|nr:DUF397 domain-containing protein [Streptomyces natalensis]KIZ13322.1 toxin [Streptomyces natalensis ATCC 27448]